MRLAIGAAITLGALALFLGPRPCFADEAPQQPLAALLGKGFRIVATSFIPGEIQSDKRPVILVTLQADKVIAVCTYSVGNWETIATSGSADNPKQCDVKAGQ